MTLLAPDVKEFVGVQSEQETACDAVERGAVRRYAQAIMDDDPIYYAEEAAERYGGSVAPPLYPMYMFRRDFGTLDPIQQNAKNPNFDGIVGSTAQGLPPLPLPGLALLNAGSEVELFRYARHGETVAAKSSYESIYEKQGSKGPMLFVIIKTEYRAANGELLMIVRKTQIRR